MPDFALAVIALRSKQSLGILKIGVPQQVVRLEQHLRVREGREEDGETAVEGGMRGSRGEGRRNRLEKKKGGQRGTGSVRAMLMFQFFGRQKAVRLTANSSRRWAEERGGFKRPIQRKSEAGWSRKRFK